MKSFVIAMILIIAAAFSFSNAFAQSEEGINDTEDIKGEDYAGVNLSAEIKEKIKKSDLPNETLNYIKKFIKKSGVDEEEINEIDDVDLDDLPKEVKIKNVKETNIGIYEINYTEETEQKKVYVVTYSSPSFKATENPIVASKNVNYLNFGLSGNSTTSAFLKTATGVMTSADAGYVMMRTGSITGISTNLEIMGGTGKLKIKVYKNGEDTGFENIIDVPPEGPRIDYDTQSEYIDEFSPGDAIAVYVEVIGNVEWRNAITMVEITTD